MTEAHQAEINKLNQQVNWSSQKIYELEKAFERLKFEKEAQIEELTHKLWLSSNGYDQVMSKYQEAQSQYDECKKRVFFLEAENGHILEQLRYAQASEAELRNTAQHYHAKSNNLEFNLDYKNYLLSNHQDLYEKDANHRADTEYFNTLTTLDAPQQAEFSHAHEFLVSEPPSSPPSEDSHMDFEDTFNEPSQELTPCRTQSFGKPSRESSKLARRPQNTRFLRKITTTTKPLPPKRK